MRRREDQNVSLVVRQAFCRSKAVGTISLTNDDVSVASSAKQQLGFSRSSWATHAFASRPNLEHRLALGL